MANIYTLSVPFDVNDEVHSILNGRIFTIKKTDENTLLFMDAYTKECLVVSTQIEKITDINTARFIFTKSGTVYHLINIYDIIPTVANGMHRPYDARLISSDAEDDGSDDEKVTTASLYGGDPNIIFNVRIISAEKFGEMAKVIADVNDGRKDVTIFEFCDDEISFSPSELNGLTIEKAIALKALKDDHYLKS